MLEFYEPCLNLMSNEDHSIMGAIVALKEPVEGKILQEVVDELQVRFPYFYVKAVYSGDDIIAVPNSLPMTVRNTWNPISLNSEESNYHLAAWKYEEHRLSFEILHALTDGDGFLPYIKSVLFLYLSKATGESFNPAGFRLPGDVMPASETGNPFMDISFDDIKAPFYKKKPIQDFFRLITGMDNEKRVFYLKLNEANVMKYCRDKDASPNVLFSVLLAKAARRYDPVSEKTITVSVIIDHKAILGNNDNYRLFVGEAVLDFLKSRETDDIVKSCTIARGQLMLQAQPENSLWEIKQRKQMQPTPPQDIAQASICVSYPKSRSFGPLDPYIKELYIITSLSKITDILCEVSCINHSFFLSFIQPFSSEKYLECFLRELRTAEIGYEIISSEPIRMCRIESMKKG